MWKKSENRKAAQDPKGEPMVVQKGLKGNKISSGKEMP